MVNFCADDVFLLLSLLINSNFFSTSSYTTSIGTRSEIYEYAEYASDGECIAIPLGRLDEYTSQVYQVRHLKSYLLLHVIRFVQIRIFN